MKRRVVLIGVLLSLLLLIVVLFVVSRNRNSYYDYATNPSNTDAPAEEEDSFHIVGSVTIVDIEHFNDSQLNVLSSAADRIANAEYNSDSVTFGVWDTDGDYVVLYNIVTLELYRVNINDGTYIFGGIGE